MQDARYLRDQAALCLAIAQQVSDPRKAANLRATAARYSSAATDLEKQQEGTQPDACGPDGNPPH